METMTLTPGERLLLARRRAGLSRAELGAAVGCSQAVLSYYERDLRAPSVALVRRLAARLGVAPAWLAGLDEGGGGGVVTVQYQTRRAA